MKKRKLAWLILLVGLVLAGTTWLLDARADDTYNFYFQKAPGPVTVNQGASTAGAPDLKLKNETVVPPAANAATPTSASVAAAPAPTEEASHGPRFFKIAGGIAYSQFSGGGSGSPGEVYGPPAKSGMYNAAQGVLSLGLNFSEYFALELEGSKVLSHPSTTYNGATVASTGSPYDLGAVIAVTPFHLPLGSAAKLNLAGEIGATTVSYLAGGYAATGESDGTPLEFRHAGSLVYGGRAQFVFGERVGIEATIRRLDRFSATQGLASLAVFL